MSFQLVLFPFKICLYTWTVSIGDLVKFVRVGGYSSHSSTYFPVNVKYFKPHVVDIIEYESPEDQFGAFK